MLSRWTGYWKKIMFIKVIKILPLNVQNKNVFFLHLHCALVLVLGLPNLVSLSLWIFEAFIPLSFPGPDHAAWLSISIRPAAFHLESFWTEIQVEHQKFSFARVCTGKNPSWKKKNPIYCWQCRKTLFTFVKISIVLEPSAVNCGQFRRIFFYNVDRRIHTVLGCKLYSVQCTWKHTTHAYSSSLYMPFTVRTGHAKDEEFRYLSWTITGSQLQ